MNYNKPTFGGKLKNKAMDILNLIELDEYNSTIGITSFAVIDDQLIDEVVSEAEEEFTKILEGHNVSLDDIDVALQDGRYRREFSLFLVWSHVENVQV